MIQNDDGSVTLEKGEGIDLQAEIHWVVNEWLSDDEYDGVLIFGGAGRSAGYLLFPYVEPGLYSKKAG